MHQDSALWQEKGAKCLQETCKMMMMSVEDF